MINRIALKIAFPAIPFHRRFASPRRCSHLAGSAASNSVTGDSKLFLSGGLLLSALLCGLTVWASFHHMRRLSRVVRAADNLAKGDFGVEFSLHSKDEVGQLQAALQETVTYLRETAGVA
jgi:HAMP domain-containing protein